MHETLDSMSFNLEIKQEANDDIIAAYLYYEDKRTGLGEEFLAHLEIYLKRILENPKHFPHKRKPFREAFIKRFPFIVVYEIMDFKVLVFAVFNTYQNPEKKIR